MESKPASQLSLDQLAELFNKAFQGYIGRIVSFTAESLAGFITNSHISLPHSHVFYLEEDLNTPVGFIYIAIRADKPTEPRLVAMGIIPECKGRGVGTEALKKAIAAEEARDVSILELEVIQQNPAAVKLYKRAGFTVHRELLGWERDAPADGEYTADPELTTCTFEEVDELVKTHGSADLPWQAWGFSKNPDTSRAFKLGNAFCVTTNPEDQEADTVKLQCLIVDPQYRNTGQATRLIKAMMARYPGKKWSATPIFPKEYGESIAKELKFAEMDITQYQMRLTLGQP